MTVRIGISGWRYPRWRGTFYPQGLPQRQELRYAAERMNSVEINGSFYSLQRRSYFEQWVASTPNDFIFAVKGGRFITHMKKLRDIETPLANFFASGVLALDQKLGPIMWQLPPNLGFDAERMSEFLAQLPRTAGSAVDIARHHDQRIPDDQALVKTTHPRRRLRHAIEVRHESFRSQEFYELLRRYQMALVISDNPGKWPIFTEITTDLMYVRLHGHSELYASGYSDRELDEWAAKIRSWVERGCDVCVYFDNDAKVHAPFDAISLMDRLGLSRQPS